jgi:hypothetical protein
VDPADSSVYIGNSSCVGQKACCNVGGYLSIDVNSCNGGNACSYVSGNTVIYSMRVALGSTHVHVHLVILRSMRIHVMASMHAVVSLATL